jgi:hypothetical protein
MHWAHGWKIWKSWWIQLTVWRENSYKSWNQWHLDNQYSLIESKSLLVLCEHSCDAFLVWVKHEVVTLIIFMKIYSLMSFDAFNGSLVEHCPIHVAGLKSVTHSRIQGTTRAKSPKVVNWWSPVWPVTSTGLTGAGPVKLLAGDPTPDPGLTQLSRKMVIWSQRLWETQYTSINKSLMCYDQVWNESHQNISSTI